MPNITDEELNGAAAALLGLHARNGGTAVPPPIVPPPRPIPLSLPDLDHSRSQYHRWSSGQGKVSPSVPPEPADDSARTHRSTQDKEPTQQPYPFYASPVLATGSAAAGPLYAEQHHRLSQEHVDYYNNPPAASVVSTRGNFLATVGRGDRLFRQPPPATAAATPRRRVEWTPCFGPPMAVDPRQAVLALHSPAVDARAFLLQRHNHQPQQQGSDIPSPPSQPTSSVGPAGASSRQMHVPVYQESAEAHHHVIRDRYHQDFAPAATADPAPSSSRGGGSGGDNRLQQREYEQHEGYPYPRQHGYQQQQQQQQQLYHQQKHREFIQQQQRQQRQPQQQRKGKPSINNLWSLIPGTIERGGSRLGNSTTTTTAASIGGIKNDGDPAHSKQQNGRSVGHDGDRWFAPDVHPPLSDLARRHRARALARLRARRRSLAEAAAAATAPSRPAPVKRHSSETTNEADSGSDGEDDAHHRSKVFLVDGGGGLPRAVGGGIARGGSGGSVARTVSGDWAPGEEEEEAAPSASAVADGSEKERASPAAGGGMGGSSGGGGGGDVAETPSKCTAADSAIILSSSSGTVASAATGPSSSPAPNTNASSQSGSKNNASKVGDLFQLMHNVTMSFGGRTAEPADGEENLARELGKPVKYRYRQEAARSRKRTRGRFVSEKAPAFVSITELMALRRAERERQQKSETAPVPVGAG